MDNKNVFVAIALSMSVLLFWGAFFETPRKPTDQKNNRIVEKKVEVEVPVDKEVVKWKTRVVQVPLYSTQPGLVDLDPDILSKATIEKSDFSENKPDDEEKNK